MKTVTGRARTSFRFKIISVSVLAMCIMMAAIAVVWYAETSREARISAERYIGNVLSRLNESFETMVRDVDHLVTSASIDQANVISVISGRERQTAVEKLEGNQTIMSTMLSLYQFKTYMEGLLITTPQGNYYRVGACLPYKQLISQPWFGQVEMEGGKSVILPPHSNGSDMVISVVRNIISGNKILGVVKADMKCKILDDCYNMDFKGFGRIYILDDGPGTLIYPLEEEGGQTAGEDLLACSKSMGEEGSFYAEIGGVPCLVIYSRSGLTGWITAGVVPRTEIAKEFRSVSIMALVLSIMLGTGIIGVLYVLLSAQVNKVGRLCEAVRRIDKTALMMEPVIRSEDEIGLLQDQIIRMVERIRLLISSVRDEQNEKRRLEMRMLQNQINPHFLHNTLNTIKHLALLQDASNIVEVSDGLSVLLRNNMKEEEYLTVGAECGNMEGYLNIQKYKYSGKFEYQIMVEPGLEGCWILKMLIQPFLENALKHGIGPMKGMGLLTVKIFTDDGCLAVNIADNGVGMSDERLRQLTDSPETGAGIGIRNVIRRIRLHYGAPYGVSIRSSSLGTVVELLLPLKEEGPDK